MDPLPRSTHSRSPAVLPTKALFPLWEAAFLLALWCSLASPIFKESLGLASWKCWVSLRRLGSSRVRCVLACTLVWSLCACATDKPSSEDVRHAAYLKTRTEYYMTKGGISDSSMATSAAELDWTSHLGDIESEKRGDLNKAKADTVVPNGQL